MLWRAVLLLQLAVLVSCAPHPSPTPSPRHSPSRSHTFNFNSDEYADESLERSHLGRFRRPSTNWRPMRLPSRHMRSPSRPMTSSRKLGGNQRHSFGAHDFESDFGHHDFEQHHLGHHDLDLDDHDRHHHDLIEDTKHSDHFGDVYYDDHHDSLNEIAQYTDLFPGPLDYDLLEGKDFDASKVDMTKFNDFSEAERHKPRLPDGHFLGANKPSSFSSHGSRGHLSAITDKNIYRKDVPIKYISNTNDKVTPFLEPAGIKNLKPSDISFIKESARESVREREKAKAESHAKSFADAEFERKLQDQTDSNFGDVHSTLLDYF